MIHACEISKEPGIQGICGLLGKDNVAGPDPEGFILALREIVEHFQITWGVTPLHASHTSERALRSGLLFIGGELANTAPI